MPKQQEAIFAELRKQEIVQLVNAQGRVTVKELCQKFAVSPATIRNDLNELERNGLLKRAHGGALSKTGGVNFELTSKEKEGLFTAQKKAIAREAVRHIMPGDFVAIDTGTTTMELAKLIPKDSELTVVTNDLKIALYLEQNSEIPVVLLGGTVRKGFHCTVGKNAIDTMDLLHIDTLFLATNGLNLKRGFSTPNIEVANIKSKMINIAKKVVLLADSSKLDRDSLVLFAAPTDVDTIITDDGIDEKHVQEAQACGIEIVRAKVD
jgi:DeoR family fructose operon transcriptional repressor